MWRVAANWMKGSLDSRQTSGRRKGVVVVSPRRIAAGRRLGGAIEVLYPGGDSWSHRPTWWVVSFFVISMIVALLFKALFTVTF